MVNLKGIDISHHQPQPRWDEVVADGVRFCVCRATYGTKVDKTFAKYFTGAKAAGIIPGAYHFLRFNNQTAHVQADAFLSEVRGVTIGSPLLIALDLEGNDENGDQRVDANSADEYMQLVRDWLGIVETALDRECIIYTGPSFWTAQVGGANLLPRPLWIAHYTNKPAPKVPAPWTDWSFWQFTGSGEVKGIDAQVDVNWFQGDEERLKHLAFKRGDTTDAPDAPDIVEPVTDEIDEIVAVVEAALRKWAETKS